MSRKECNTGPTFGQWAALGFCVALGLIAVTITAAFNIGFGAQFGPDIAFVFAFVALIVGGMPLLANASGGWTVAGRAVWALAVVLSLTAAASHVLESQSNVWAKVAAGKAKAGNHSADEARTRANLDRITETATAESLVSQVATAERKLAEETKDAKEAGIECSKRRKCDAATTALQALRDRHGHAVARDGYKAELTALKAASVAAEPVKTIGMGESLATLTGANASQANAFVGAFVLSAILLLLEISAAYFWSQAGKLIASINAARKAARKPGKPIETLNVEAEAPRSQRDETLLKVQMMIWNSPEGRLLSSRNALADALDVKRTTFRGWFKMWEKAGLVGTESNGKRTFIVTKAAKAA